MGSTAKKINFMIDEDVREEFEAAVPAGLRSRVVNEALRRELLRVKRLQATELLDQFRRKGEDVSTQDIVSFLRKDRRSH